MFGDSIQSSPVSTLGRQSAGSLASLYQARKANDSATVEQIKQHFQKQIEQMLQSSQKHDVSRQFPLDPPPQFNNNETPRERPGRELRDNPAVSRVSIGAQTRRPGGLTETSIERGKSFQEARSAVQRQIEKMFVDTQGRETGGGQGQGIKHSSHGVSHVTPEEEEQ